MISIAMLATNYLFKLVPISLVCCSYLNYFLFFKKSIAHRSTICQSVRSAKHVAIVIVARFSRNTLKLFNDIYVATSCTPPQFRLERVDEIRVTAVLSKMIYIQISTRRTRTYFISHDHVKPITSCAIFNFLVSFYVSISIGNV